MAASLSIFTGQPKALLKLNLIQPPPKLCGSRRGCSLMIGPGYPKDTLSNFQSFTHFLTTRTILPAVIVGPEGILRGSFCPVASSLMLVPPVSMTRTFGVCAARTLFTAVAPMAPRGYGFFSPIGKGIPEGRMPLLIQSLFLEFRVSSPQPQKLVLRKPDHSDRDNALGEYRTSPDSLPRPIMIYLPQVRLAYAESLSREASPSLAIATRAAPPWLIPLAVSSPQDSRNSALWLAKCFLGSAAKFDFCGSAQRRVRNESQSDTRWSPSNQPFLGRCERSSTILQSHPLDQEEPNRDRAARREPGREQKARIAAAGHPASTHKPQRRLPGVQEPQRLRRGPSRQPQSENQVRLLEVGHHRRAAQRQHLRLQSARERQARESR